MPCLILIAKDERAFERLYEKMKEEMLKLLEKIAEAEEEKGGELTEEEVRKIVGDWLEEVDSDAKLPEMR